MDFNILIVDDSAVTRAVIKRTIKLSGIQVGDLLEAAHGKAALDVLAAKPVHLVLADLNMPEMSGLEMAQAMRQSPATRDIPVVVISAEPNEQRLDGLKEVGIRAYLRKPFTPEGVRDVVCSVMNEVCHA